MLRTWWCRKLRASARISDQSPSRRHVERVERAPGRLGLAGGGAEGGEIVAAEQDRGGLAHDAASSGCGTCQTRRSRPGRARRLRMHIGNGGRWRRSAGSIPRGPGRPASTTSGCGLRWKLIASCTARASKRSGRSIVATWPAACTPASVRPATTLVTGRRPAGRRRLEQRLQREAVLLESASRHSRSRRIRDGAPSASRDTGAGRDRQRRAAWPRPPSAPRPGRCTRRSRSAPSPQATSRPVVERGARVARARLPAPPRAPSGSRRASSVHAPGQGTRPRIRRSRTRRRPGSSRAGRRRGSAWARR